MGMAASQARHLALVARKSNCEYEGQQINQARTALANQSANLFNQMLGLNVPVPPSTQDFTKTQYSYTDGLNESTISSWQQLATHDEDYNYVVTSHYYTDVYTGSIKKLSDPQVQFTRTGVATNGTEIQAALKEMTRTYDLYLAAQEERKAAEAEAATLKNYADTATYTKINGNEYSIDDKTYKVSTTDGEEYEFLEYDAWEDETVKESAFNTIKTLIKQGAIDKTITTQTDEDGNVTEVIDMSDIYMNTETGDVVFKKDLDALYNGSTGEGKTTLPTYKSQSVAAKAEELNSILTEKKLAENEAWNVYSEAEAAYESLKRPTYIGNCELVPLATLTEDEEAEIAQIIKDMEAQEIDANILKCFTDGKYTGGIYSFTLNGIKYYTTYSDLEQSYNSGTGNNHIDGQTKLAYHNATYISTKIENTQKALIETDGNGRFTSIRFEDDSVKYTLNMETVTDEVAYQDAMNQYNYENAKYDKMIQDINAKTSIIQQEDQQLELRLKQLDTEQKALSAEIEAVSSVVKKNVEDTFKTFSG